MCKKLGDKVRIWSGLYFQTALYYRNFDLQRVFFSPVLITFAIKYERFTSKLPPNCNILDITSYFQSKVSYPDVLLYVQSNKLLIRVLSGYFHQNNYRSLSTKNGSL